MATLLTEEEKHAHFRAILTKLTPLLPTLTTKQDLFDTVIREISTLPHFQWTGIYEYDVPQETLTLHPMYIGLPTDHISIKKGQGVCGTAVAQNKDIIVEDVTQLDNYLACSTQTKAEIVVLLKRGDIILGQIDVDSDESGAFDEVDREYLNWIASLLVENLPN
ncbi:MAG: GAF domain-containing protein [Promethearchaeota archaeon]